MEKKVVSGVMLTLLLASMLTLAFDIRQLHLVFEGKAETTAPVFVVENKVVFETGATYQWLDPHVSYYQFDFWTLWHSVETLFWYERDNATKIVPWLAESFTASADQRQYNITLRQGITFQDGTPFNATAVWFSMNRLLILDGTSGDSMVHGSQAAWILQQLLDESLSSALSGEDQSYNATWVQAVLDQNFVEILDTYKVRLNLLTPSTQFLPIMAGPWASIISPTSAIQMDYEYGGWGTWDGNYTTYFLNRAGDGNTYFNLPENGWKFGTGAYYVESVNSATYKIKLKAYDNYWGGPNNMNLPPAGKNRIETIEFVYLPSFATRLLDLKAGTATGVAVSTSDIFQIVDRDKWIGEGILESIVPGVTMHGPFSQLMTWWLCFNTNVSRPDGTLRDWQPFADWRIRMAVASSVNITAMNIYANSRLGVVANSIIPPSTFPPGSYTPDVMPTFYFNLTRARELLLTAGLDPVTSLTNYNGTAVPGGIIDNSFGSDFAHAKVVEFYVQSGADTFLQVLTTMADNLNTIAEEEDLGIRFNVVIVPSGQQYTLASQHLIDSYMGGWIADYNHVLDWLAPMYRSTGTYFSWNLWNLTRLDALYDEALAADRAGDLNELLRANDEMNRVANEALPYMVWWHPTLQFARSTWLKGWSVNTVHGVDLWSTMYYEAPIETRTIFVPDEYPTIQEAIDNASPGDTIFVRIGTYYERIIVDKPLTLIGESKSTTIIDGGTPFENTAAVRIVANNSVLKGFTTRIGGFFGPVSIIINNSANTEIVDNNLIALGSVGGVSVYNSRNITITENRIIGRTFGILLGNSFSSTVTGNNLTDIVNSGIWLSESFNNTIADNRITSWEHPQFGSSGVGIHLTAYPPRSGTAYNTFRDNDIRNCSAAVVTYPPSGSPPHHDNIFLRNNFANNIYGVHLWHSANFTFRENTFSKNTYNLGVEGIDLLDFVHNIDTSNTVNGKPVYYLVNQHNLALNPSTAPNVGYLALINSTNITVENLDLKENIQGLLMASTNSSQIIKNCITSNDLAGIHFDILCFNNTVSGNSITDQDWSGVLSKYSFNNTLIGNTVSNNTIGFYLKTSFNNALTQNILANNSRGGVWLDYSFNNILVSNTIMGNSAKQISDAGVSLYQSYINKIFHNNFINNQRQAYTCPGNIWDDGYPSGGNYWSDYSGADQYRGVYQSFDGNDGIGDTPYIVDASNKDQYPLMQPWTPVLISIEPQTTIGTPVGETFTIDINISNVRNLYLWQFKLVFNPAIISATIVAQGPFLEQAGTTFFIPMVDNTQGYVLVGAFLRGPPPPEGAYGNGTLASVTFQVKSAGQTPIQFDKMWTKLRTDMMGSIIPIEHETRDGYFSNPVISCNVNIDPDTLNLKSKSKWITAYIQLPEGYNAEDIDASTILLNGTIQPILESKYDFVTNSTEYIVDHNGDGILERMVKFNKTEVASWIHDDLNIQYGNLTLTITGKLLDETLFEATNIIKVLFPGDADGDGDVDFDDFIILAGCYGGNAGTSSYDQLADFNQDGPIDFDDFVILAGNYGKTAL